MNKKDNPDLVRKFQYTVWLNTPERDRFLENLDKANGMKEADFMRSMMQHGYVQAPIERADKIEARELLRLLLEYRTNFKRIGNLMKDKDTRLNDEVQTTVKAIQSVIDRL